MQHRPAGLDFGTSNSVPALPPKGQPLPTIPMQPPAAAPATPN